MVSASAFSAGVAGATYPWPALRLPALAGAGRRLRSALPPVVTGMAGSSSR